MLKKLSNKSVEDPGIFRLIVPNIHVIEYAEGDKKLIVEIEFGRTPTGESIWSVYSEILRGWLPPYDEEHLTTIDKDRILRNIVSGLKLLDMSCEIVPPVQ